MTFPTNPKLQSTRVECVIYRYDVSRISGLMDTKTWISSRRAVSRCTGIFEINAVADTAFFPSMINVLFFAIGRLSRGAYNFAALKRRIMCSSAESAASCCNIDTGTCAHYHSVWRYTREQWLLSVVARFDTFVPGAFIVASHIRNFVSFGVLLKREHFTDMGSVMRSAIVWVWQGMWVSRNMGHAGIQRVISNEFCFSSAEKI